MTEVKLSICIATLNRAVFIGETLGSIISQVTDEVEIVVLDGGSTDNTTQVVQQYQQRFPRLRYFRQDAPMGVDQDFCRAVELAKGDYCWLMSDDDILKPGAIHSVLNETLHDYGLIIVNAEVKNTDLTNILEQKILRFTSNRIYKPTDSQKFFVETARYLSFIGCVIIKRSLWNTREKEKYFGTAFIHVGVIFQSLLMEDAIVIAEPFIAIRAGNAQWTSKSFEIWFFKWPKLIWSFSHYSNLAKNQVCPEKPYKKILTLLHARGEGSFSLEVYYKRIKPLLSSWLDRATAKTIAILPAFFVNLLGIIYFSSFRRSHLSRYNLKNSRFYYRHYLKSFLEKLAICVK